MPSTQQKTFVVADDHPLFRLALRQAIEAGHPQAKVLEAECVDAIAPVVEGQRTIALLLLDLHMPGASGFSALIHMNAHFPEIPVMMVSADATTEVMTRALRHGAAGFLPKSSSMATIQTAIDAVLAGGRWLPAGFSPAALDTREEEAVAGVLATLTPQQFRVASLLSQGLLNKQIASQMQVTEATVKAHATEIYRKLGVNSRTQAVLSLQALAVK
ncbi:response regulator transcription factor [Simiduia sp. 21SJ11W-1]|uniref:response regulator transcription factor n=1 Tax=Simiduia sp. 21SJ11W-1 TaxID=2909669 RepID=UPI00209CF8E6|nr:response regulator transcription factor [Simiduia sp. 21SJ11W-1]UTA46464.1 response regulator transcription factor [Simiduia sp. 21SJ11W-1]